MRLRGFPLTKGLLILLVAGSIVILSCSRKKNQDEILSPEQMVGRLADVYLLEQKTMRLGQSSDSGVIAFNYMKTHMFKSIGLEDSVFRKSYNYYVDRPAELEKIYTGLIDTLNLREQRADMAPLK